jgi:hypothetical protein
VLQWAAQWAADDCRQCRSSAMGGNATRTAVAITMEESGVIVMDSSSGNGQQWRNRQRDSKAIAMGNGMPVAQWTAQWAADNCQQMRGQRWKQCLVFGWLVSCEITRSWQAHQKNIQVRMSTYIRYTFYYEGKKCLKPQYPSILKITKRPSSKKGRKYFSYLGFSLFLP